MDATPSHQLGRASAAFRKYLLPGFVFQSVVIAGGYGTGREIVEFFMTQGPVGGLLGMLLVSTVIWSAVSAVSFEFSRRYGAYEYRAFFRRLLGPGWVLFEICYLAMLAVVLAVIAAAAGSMLQETFGLPYVTGVVGIMLAVGFLVFKGSATIERALAGWSFVLYGVYIVMFAWAFSVFGDEIVGTLASGPTQSGWFVGGLQYAGYNLAVIPAVLFAVRHANTRRQAVTAGVLAGPIAIIPGLLFYLAMLGQYPAILDRSVPANALLEVLGSRGFQILFQVVLFGTLIETGTGMIHAVNERLAGYARERGRELSSYVRPVTAVSLLLVASLFARIGLIDLIAKGYGALAWAFLGVFVIPVLTRGLWMLLSVRRT